MTEQEIKLAASIIDAPSLTDAELKSAIKATRLVIAYLSERGIDWSLAVRPLRRDLESLEGFARNRNMKGILT